MKTMKITCLLTALLISPQVPAASKSAPIKRVVVFSDRAEVTREISAVCSQGKAEAEFLELPVSLDKRTLKAGVLGKAEVIGLSSRVIPLEQDLDARVARIREQMQKLDDQIAGIQNSQAVQSERGTLIAGFGNYFADLLNEEVRNARPDPARWANVLDMMRAEKKALAEKNAALSKKMRELMSKKRMLVQNLQVIRPRGAKEARTAVVTIDCRGVENVKVGLSYVVPGATWHPEYDLRYTPPRGRKVGRGSVELTVSAVVQQATGEDWRNVKLVLSTAKPRLGAEAPYPAPLYINGHEVSDEKVLVATSEKREKLRSTAGATGGAPSSAALDDKGQSFSLTLPRRVTVESDGRPYWMPVDVLRAKGKAGLVAIPKLRPYVYQAVELKNPAAYSLLSGRLHAYRAGSYVGDTKLDFTAPGEPMEISLGIDEELKVERKDLFERKRKPGFLSSTRHIEYAYHIEVSNRASKRQVIEVRENIPVSKIEDVEVELLKKKTSPNFRLDRHRGIIKWSLGVEPGREKSLDLAYTIHLPEDWDVRGF